MNRRIGYSPFVIVVVINIIMPEFLQNYKVGPLVDGKVDLDAATYEEMYEANTIPWAKRQLGPVDWFFLQDAPPYQAFKLKELFKATTGYCYGFDYNYTEHECGFENLSFWDYTSMGKFVLHVVALLFGASVVRLTRWFLLLLPATDSVSTEKRIHALHFWINPSDQLWGYPTLHPVPISFNYIEDPETDPIDWETYNFEYCFQGPYDTAEDLLAAFEAGELTICEVTTTDFAWSNTVGTGILHDRQMKT